MRIRMLILQHELMKDGSVDVVRIQNEEGDGNTY